MQQAAALREICDICYHASIFATDLDISDGKLTVAVKVGFHEFCDSINLIHASLVAPITTNPVPNVTHKLLMTIACRTTCMAGKQVLVACIVRLPRTLAITVEVPVVANRHIHLSIREQAKSHVTVVDFVEV